MSKYIKELLVKELESRFGDVDEFVVVSVKGVNGNENNQMRGELKEKGIRLNIVKNSVMRHILANTGRESVSVIFNGPCAIAYGGESVVDIAREIVSWSRKNKVELKGAFVDGEVMDSQGALELSKMLSRKELQGSIILLAQSPGAVVSGAIIGPAGIIAGCIESIVDKAEKAA